MKEIKEKADRAHEEFLKFKMKVKDKNEEIKEIKSRIKEIEEKQMAEIKEEAIRSIEKRAKEKLKKGEKLTWEEFKLLAEKGVI